VLARAKLKRFFLKSLRYRVTGVMPLGKDARSIELEPENHPVFDYIPGQFAFLTFISEHIADEEHPYTISSTPTRPSSLQFNIRCSGDWTRHIGRLRIGDKARIDGPYGRFSHLSLTGQGDLVMIAGGIGITPMLSMLRYMADVNDPRRISLIWSNRAKEDVILPDEFRDFEQRLKGLEMTQIFTREPGETGKKGRLDRNRLQKLLSGCSKESRFFLCGPPKMMQAVHRALIQLGFPSHAIHMEQFRL
jgi:predicted ferric reductase